MRRGMLADGMILAVFLRDNRKRQTNLHAALVRTIAICHMRIGRFASIRHDFSRRRDLQGNSVLFLNTTCSSSIELIPGVADARRAGSVERTSQCAHVAGGGPRVARRACP